MWGGGIKKKKRESPVSDEFSLREQSLYVPAVAYWLRAGIQ